jgi:F-type H+-transporting ATPase subunit b
VRRVARTLLLAAALGFGFGAAPAHGQEEHGAAHEVAGEHGAEAPAHGDAHGDTQGEHHGPTPDVSGLVRHSINLALLLALLVWALRTPLGDALRFRRLEIKEQLDAAFQAKAAAEARHKELESRLARFESELKSMLSAVHDDAAAERKRLTEQAQQSAALLEAAARRSIDEELRRASTALRAEAVELATEAAARVLQAELGAADHARLHADYVQRVERKGEA